jgi:succinate dehydrogenase / fumarate reductase flavoprotein subunit
MSESLRNDGRVWVPRKKGDSRPPGEIPDAERDYFLERMYPTYGNLAPRDVSSRAAKAVCDEGRGVGPGGLGVYLDFRHAFQRLGRGVLDERYGNLFEMYERITGEDPHAGPMRIYPAVHYVMGGLWVDYDLMSTVPGLFVGGEANFSDHGANRLGASALMQGLADGYFILPYTVGDYVARGGLARIDAGHAAFRDAEREVEERTRGLLSIRGTKPADHFHRELGELLWNDCGMARSKESLTRALDGIARIREAFWKDLRVTGGSEELNQELERAGRVADYFELAELMCFDALHRNESAGGHFRIEHQTPDGEALRNDAEYAYVAAWEWKGADTPPVLHEEPLAFEHVPLAQRSYR